MQDYLCISVTFLDSRFHGRQDRNTPEWPPSPLRLFQAIIAANADQIGSGGEFDHAMRWLEQQSPPLIIAPEYEEGAPYCISVPNNAMDIIGKAWSKDNYFGKGKDNQPATHRTMKTIFPVRMKFSSTVHYLWQICSDQSAVHFFSNLIKSANRVFALGLGIDLVTSCADVKNSQQITKLVGERWFETKSISNCVLRAPIQGTLDALIQSHNSFLGRIRKSYFIPANPLTHYSLVNYTRPTDPIIKPYAVFELRQADGSYSIYDQKKLIHISGMTRHLALKLMQFSPPPSIKNPKRWVDCYVAGHMVEGSKVHHQFSYIPLPSIGHTHSDQFIRRVMIMAPTGGDENLDYLSRRIEGHRLIPEYGNEFDRQEMPFLVRTYSKTVTKFYTKHSNLWASVTPIILPGHDDRKRAKTIKLIEKALEQSGVVQKCSFEFSPFSRWPKSISAHKYNRDKKAVGYIRPDHLLTNTAVHLIIRFNDNLKVPGPLCIGAGRHYGFGIMAGIFD